MMIDNITFEECDSPEKLAKLREFAATFDPPHTIDDDHDRIIIVKKNSIWIGYSEIISTPVVYSSWGPNCGAKDIIDGMKSFVGWSRIQHGDGYTVVPLNTKNFPEKIMNKLGFYRLKVELYRIFKGP